MKGKLVILIIFCNLHFCMSQCLNTKQLEVTKDADNLLFVKKLFADKQVSSFFIEIQKEVKLHKHANHSEHVLILSGKGKMQLGDSIFVVKPNDLIFIPPNTPHKLTVKKKPVKCISIQAPYFDGTDRIMLE